MTQNLYRYCAYSYQSFSQEFLFLFTLNVFLAHPNDSYCWIFRQFVDFIFFSVTTHKTYTPHNYEIYLYIKYSNFFPFVWLTMFIYYSNKYLIKRQFTYRFAANKQMLSLQLYIHIASFRWVIEFETVVWFISPRCQYI